MFSSTPGVRVPKVEDHWLRHPADGGNWNESLLFILSNPNKFVHLYVHAVSLLVTDKQNAAKQFDRQTHSSFQVLVTQNETV
jgi:hypothetical protein